MSSNLKTQFKGATGGGRMLSEHFSEYEFVHSDTAIKMGIMNVPDHEQISNMKLLCEKILEPARKAIGGMPIIITSGFRREELNKAVGGVANSQHLTGEAVDIKCFEYEPIERKFLKSIIDNPHLGQLLFEHAKGGVKWYHVSIDAHRTPRRYINLSYNAKYRH